MTKLNLGSGPAPLDGFTNLDLPDWRFEDGLPDYADGSVEAVTISHVLMYVDLNDWHYVFAELARVLAPSGIVRITEDDTENPESERHAEPWPDAVTLTGPKLLRKHLRAAGLVANQRAADETGWRDFSLCQDLHGGEPKVCFVEGRKP